MPAHWQQRQRSGMVGDGEMGGVGTPYGNVCLEGPCVLGVGILVQSSLGTFPVADGAH